MDDPKRRRTAHRFPAGDMARLLGPTPLIGRAVTGPRITARELAQLARKQPFSRLPPDVIVTEILNHVDFMGFIDPYPNRHWRFGRFLGDVLRYPWFVFRNVYIDFEALFNCVDVGLGTPAEPKYGVLNRKLPLAKLKQIYQLKFWGTIPPRVGYRQNILFTLWKSYQWGKSRRVQEYTEFKGVIHRIISIIVKNPMPVLSSTGGYMWGILNNLNLLTKFSGITMIDFKGYGDWNLGDVLPKVENTAVRTILHLSQNFGDPRDPSSKKEPMTRFFERFSNLDRLTFVPDNRSIPEMPIGNEVGAVLVSRHMRSLCLGNILVLSAGVNPRWTRNITKKLCVSGQLTGWGRNMDLPTTSPYLDILKLQHYEVPVRGTRAMYGSPNKIVFKNCTFLSNIITLHERTTTARFEEQCVWIEHPITITGNNLVKIYWSVRDGGDWDVTLNLPNLKKAYFWIDDEDDRQSITINSAAHLDSLIVHSFWPIDGQMATTMNATARLLILENCYPNLRRLQHTVEELRLVDPPAMKYMSFRGGFDPQLKRVVVESGCLVEPQAHYIAALGRPNKQGEEEVTFVFKRGGLYEPL